MELAATQKFLTRIFTDSRLRTRFYADPVRVGAEFGLSAKVATTLADLSESDVHEFSKSVRRQRLESATRLLPSAAKCLGTRFGEAFRDFVLSHALPAESRPWNDAVAFQAFFQDWCGQHPEIPRWQREVIAYESERLEFDHSHRLLHIRLCLYPGHRTARRIAAGRTPARVPLLPGLRIFWRWNANGEMHEKLL